jgi:hypothetical protein
MSLAHRCSLTFGWDRALWHTRTEYDVYETSCAWGDAWRIARDAAAPMPARCESVLAPARRSTKIAEPHQKQINAHTGNDPEVLCDDGGNRYGNADCLNELTLCKVNLALAGLFVIFALLSLIPLMVMCCCARKPVRHAFCTNQNVPCALCKYTARWLYLLRCIVWRCDAMFTFLRHPLMR